VVIVAAVLINNKRLKRRAGMSNCPSGMERIKIQCAKAPCPEGPCVAIGRKKSDIEPKLGGPGTVGGNPCSTNPNSAACLALKGVTK
jgi:hypothetical protein